MSKPVDKVAAIIVIWNDRLNYNLSKNSFKRIHKALIDLGLSEEEWKETEFRFGYRDPETYELYTKFV